MRRTSIVVTYYGQRYRRNLGLCRVVLKLLRDAR